MHVSVAKIGVVVAVAYMLGHQVCGSRCVGRSRVVLNPLLSVPVVGKAL